MLVAAGAGGAWAESPPPGPQVVDQCGDRSLVRVQRLGSEPVLVGDDGADVGTVSVRVHRPSGAAALLTADIGLCAGSDVPESLSVHWGVGSPSCYAGVRYVTGPAPDDVSRQYVEQCDGKQTVSVRLAPQELQVSAQRVTFRVPLDRLPAARFAPGTTWREVCFTAASRSALDGQLRTFSDDTTILAVDSGYDDGVGAGYVVEG